MRFYTKPKRKPLIIVVTMIDIFCVLLIFFIVATTFRKSMPAIKIALPDATHGQKVSETEPVILSITAEEKIFLNAQEVSLADLPKTMGELGKKSPPPEIAMRADKKAPFGLIIKVMDAAKGAGFAQLPAFIEQENQGTGP